MNSSIGILFKGIRDLVEKARLYSKLQQSHVTLVAVSKTKPKEDILEVYNEGHRDFGENYVDELVLKAPTLPADIRWHFIGHLQSNKVSALLQVKNLQSVHTVDNLKLAQKLNRNCETNGRKLDILLQVKLSEEDTKFGLDQEETFTLVDGVLQTCKGLTFKGLMAIGQEGDISAFTKLFQLRKSICEKFDLKEEDLELSMGMSADFEEAIYNGSTIVRVGSSIFGARNYPKKEQTENKEEVKA